MQDIHKRNIQNNNNDNQDKLTEQNKQTVSTNSNDYQNQWPYKIHNQILINLLGGPKIIQFRYIINTFKGLTYFFITFLIWYYQNFSYGAYLYLAIHGSYGIIWVIKDITFPDISWQKPVTISSAILISCGLSLYWIMPWMLISGIGIQEPSNSRLVTVIFLYIFGISIMLISDAQKYYTLKYKKGLINSNMFKYTRNPNYLGEMALYTSFAAIVGDYRAYFIPILFWCLLFSINMYNKECSLKLKKGWAEYKQQSYILLPKIFKSDIVNLFLYIIFAIAMYNDYRVGGGITLLKSQ